MKEFKYISNISKEEIDQNTVIPCIDQQGYHAILIKNSVMKSIPSKFSTDNLNVQIDEILYFDEKEYYFHIITATKNDMYSISQFEIIYEYIFKKLQSAISGNELNILITSIEDYFRTTPDKDLFSLQVGVFGELLTIKYLYDSGYTQIVEKYHDNFYSKHDVEIDDHTRIEIKSTVSEKRIHTFKHNQIFRNDIDVYISSVMLEQSKEGVSLFDLFQEVIDLYDNPDSIFALKKLMKRCGVGEENGGLKFAIQKAYNDLKIYDAKALPKINVPAPDGVTNIKYDVDCSLAEPLNIDDFVNTINSLIKKY